MALDNLETPYFRAVFLKPVEQYFCSLLAVSCCLQFDKSYSGLPHADSRLKEFRRLFLVWLKGTFLHLIFHSTQISWVLPTGVWNLAWILAVPLGASQQKRRLKLALCETHRNENILLECCTRLATELTETTRDAHFFLRTVNFYFPFPTSASKPQS